jgi:hypothetical protein
MRAQFHDLWYIDERNVKLGFLDKLYTAKHQLEREEARTKTVENILRALMNLAEAQTGKHIKDEAANILLEYSNSLIQGL